MAITIVAIVIFAIIYITVSIPRLKKMDQLTPKNVLLGIGLLTIFLIPMIVIDYGYTHENSTFALIGFCGWFVVIIGAIIFANVISPKLKYKSILKKGIKTTGKIEKFIFSSSSEAGGIVVKSKYLIMVSYSDENNVSKTAISHISYYKTTLSFFTSLDHLDILVYKNSCIILNEVPKDYYDDNYDFNVEFVDLPRTAHDLFKKD